MDQVLLHPCGKTFGFCAKVQCDRNSINSGESHHLIRFVIIVVFIVLYSEGGVVVVPGQGRCPRCADLPDGRIRVGESLLHNKTVACALFGKERPLRARVPAAWGMDIVTCTPRAPAPFLLSGPGTTACLRRRLRGALYVVVHGVVCFIVRQIVVSERC